MRRALPERPGILSSQAADERHRASLRRRRARRAGKASGVARRGRAKGRAVPHRRTRELALDERGGRPIRQANRAEFDRRHIASGPSNQQGRDTGWLVYCQDMRVARRERSAQTTGPQRVRGLVLAARPRCRRTVQRHRRRLERMGLMRYGHVRRKGEKIGERDSIRVSPTWRNVTLPSGQHRQGLRPYLSVLESPKLPSVDRLERGRHPRACERHEQQVTERGGANLPAPGSDPLDGPLTAWGAQMLLQLGYG